MKIGIFDSGIGGLSVLHQAMLTLPEADYIFYADVDHVPYGEKTREEVREFVDHAVGFLVNKGCQAIVLACNTATSVAISYLRDKYKLPIIGIEPAVKPAVEHNHRKRVMVVATPVTAGGAKLKNLIMRFDDAHVVDVVALPGLVRFAQNDEFDSQNVINYLNNELAGYNLNDYSELVLGCTHFNYFKDSFAKIFPDDLEIIDGNMGVSNNLRNTIVKNGLFTDADKGRKGSVEYYYSDRKVESGAEMEHVRKLHERLERMRKI
ncbi:MAG: glutamate racemase [Lachnospira sp.]|nr:glutamate racemase [Lachnospira sp.]